jgi:serine/threonine protein kinase
MRVAVFHIREYFCTGEVLGKGTFGRVYKGCLPSLFSFIPQLSLDSNLIYTHIRCLVYLGFHKESGTIVAIKAINYINKPQTYKRALHREVDMMKYMNHPNIIRLYDAVKDEQHLYLILEYSSLGDLEKYIVNVKSGKLTEEEAHSFMIEIGM